MKNLSKQLADICLDALYSQERQDPIAIGMGLHRKELDAGISNAKPLAIQATDNKWIAALWVSASSDKLTGELLYVAKHCRSRKLALITANYYRLHALINKSNTDFYTSQQ